MVSRSTSSPVCGTTTMPSLLQTHHIQHVQVASCNQFCSSARIPAYLPPFSRLHLFFLLFLLLLLSYAPLSQALSQDAASSSANNNTIHAFNSSNSSASASSEPMSSVTVASTGESILVSATETSTGSAAVAETQASYNRSRRLNRRLLGVLVLFLLVLAIFLGLYCTFFRSRRNLRRKYIEMQNDLTTWQQRIDDEEFDLSGEDELDQLQEIDLGNGSNKSRSSISAVASTILPSTTSMFRSEYQPIGSSQV